MITVLEHPLVHSDLKILRDKHTQTPAFREAVNRIAMHLAVSVTEEIPVVEVNVETPLETTIAYEVTDKIVLIPIIRAGMGLLAPFQQLIPNSYTGYIGLRRNETTFEAEEYFFSLPKIDEDTTVIILEVMLATGGSIVNTINRLILEGASKIIVASIISAPEGVEKIMTEFPEVNIYTAALDRELNNLKYILPGLGDAGDRLNGTV